MPEIDYPPLGYVPLRALRLALVAKRLDKMTWHNPYRANGDPEKDNKTIKAIAESQDTFEEALRSGKLKGHAFDEARGDLRPLPKEFWQNEATALSLDGRLYHIAPGSSFEKEFEGTLIVVEAGHATEWLGTLGFLSSDRFFPLELIVGPSAQTSKARRKQYKWLDFHNEVIRILDEDGPVLERGFQTNLLERMELWCDQRWEKVPGRTSMQININLAVKCFLRMRRTG